MKEMGKKLVLDIDTETVHSMGPNFTSFCFLIAMWLSAIEVSYRNIIYTNETISVSLTIDANL